MKMNFTKYMMIMIIILTSMMAISSNIFMMSWMSMEINMIAFLPLMSKSMKMKDQLMKYFIIQSLASSMLLISMLINSSNETPVSSSIMLLSSLMMKMGLMPMHIWMPMIMNSMSWENCIIMTTIQKIIPITLTTQLSSMKMMYMPMIISLIMAPINAITHLSMKKIMSFSSISNTPWMINSLMNSKMQFSMFMMIYTTITMMMMTKLKKMNIMFINQTNELTKTQKTSMLIMIMSMSGMPPTTGFLPKWLILQTTVSISMSMSMSMIVSSIVSTFIYMKMMNINFMMNNTMKKTKKKKFFKTNDIAFNMLGIPIMLVMKSI
uniref:NADH dehydrogenase subunit 2 n=1 Tax=Salurnis marginella TaxID=1453305 RepID=UPI0030FE75F0